MAFFQSRDVAEGYNRKTLPPLVAEYAVEAFKEHMKEAIKPVVDDGAEDHFAEGPFLGSLHVQLVVVRLLAVGDGLGGPLAGAAVLFGVLGHSGGAPCGSTG